MGGPLESGHEEEGREQKAMKRRRRSKNFNLEGNCNMKILFKRGEEANPRPDDLEDHRPTLSLDKAGEA
jgi:hypothetical protein